MNAPYIYYMPQGDPKHGRDLQAAIKLLYGAYNVVKASLAPTPGFIYQTEKAVSASDQEVLGIVPWA